MASDWCAVDISAIKKYRYITVRHIFKSIQLFFDYIVDPEVLYSILNMAPTKQNESIVWKYFLKKDKFIVKRK
jgi:hypothetical protein